MKHSSRSPRLLTIHFFSPCDRALKFFVSRVSGLPSFTTSSTSSSSNERYYVCQGRENYIIFEIERKGIFFIFLRLSFASVFALHDAWWIICFLYLFTISSTKHETIVDVSKSMQKLYMKRQIEIQFRALDCADIFHYIFVLLM